MRRLQPLTAKPVLRSSKWMTQKANMDAKGRTSVKDRVAVRLVTTVARPKTLAKARAVALPTAASLAFSHLHNPLPARFAGRCRDIKKDPNKDVNGPFSSQRFGLRNDYACKPL